MSAQLHESRYKAVDAENVRLSRVIILTFLITTALPLNGVSGQGSRGVPGLGRRVLISKQRRGKVPTNHLHSIFTLARKLRAF